MRDLLKSVNTIWRSTYLLVLLKPAMEKKPALESSILTVLWYEAAQLFGWLIFALERCIDHSKLHYFVENLSEVAHLVFHDTCIRVITVKTQDS